MRKPAFCMFVSENVLSFQNEILFLFFSRKISRISLSAVYFCTPVQPNLPLDLVLPNSRIRQHHYTASLQLALSLCDKMLCVETDVFFSGWNSCVALASHNFFQRWEFLRPFGSKQPEVERQIPKLFSAEFLRPFGSKRTKFERRNSAEHGELIKNNL